MNDEVSRLYSNFLPVRYVLGRAQDEEVCGGGCHAREVSGGAVLQCSAGVVWDWCRNIWNIRINTVSLYTNVVSEIYSRNISLFSCNLTLFIAQVVEVADQRGAVLSIVYWLST